MARRPRSVLLLWVATGLALLVAALLLLVPKRDEPAPSPSSSPSSQQPVPSSSTTAAVPAPSTPPPATAGAAEDEQEALHGQEDVAPSFSPPLWSPEAAEAAEEAAEAVLTAWLSGEPYDQWWAQLKPLMNVAGAQIYERVDPTEITPATIQGAAIAHETTTGYLVEVTVPTTQGEYVVVLTRDVEGDPWLAERLRVPTAETPS